jgi:hypothetical protein
MLITERLAHGIYPQLTHAPISTYEEFLHFFRGGHTIDDNLSGPATQRHHRYSLCVLLQTGDLYDGQYLSDTSDRPKMLVGSLQSRIPLRRCWLGGERWKISQSSGVKWTARKSLFRDFNVRLHKAPISF